MNLIRTRISAASESRPVLLSVTVCVWFVRIISEGKIGVSSFIGERAKKINQTPFPLTFSVEMLDIFQAFAQSIYV